jgi:chemotaxis protein MotC
MTPERALACLLLVTAGVAGTTPACAGSHGKRHDAPDAKAAAEAEAAAPPATPRAKQPFDYARELQINQDYMLRGRQDALQRQSKLIGDIGEALRSAAPEVWKDERNARAAVVFACNGGGVAALREALGKGVLQKSYMDLVRGIVAYAEGRDEQATELLSEVDASELDRGIAGNVALIQAMLTMRSDKVAAIPFLDKARMLSPGTLVEESALRREVLILAGTGQPDRFMKLASQYFRRFDKSIFAAAFRRQFARDVGQQNLGTDPALYRAVGVIVDTMPSTEQLETYLQLAKQALISGRLAMAKFASHRALQLTKPDTAERARAQAYEVASAAATTDAGEALRMVQSIDRSRLDSEEAELLSVSASLATKIRQEATYNGDVDEVPPQAVSKARSTMSAADQALAEDKR